jgi:hypothetical protein
MAGFQIGDRVRLLKLGEIFFFGVAPEHVGLILETCLGYETEILGFNADGDAKLDIKELFTIWVDQSWIEKV